MTEPVFLTATGTIVKWMDHQMNSIWIKDEESKRRVLLGSQQADPPKRLQLANFFIDSEGKSRQSHLREYKLVEQTTDNEFIYAEVVPYT